jgi:hypothetical protein
VLDAVRRWTFAPLVGEDYVRDAPVAPEAIASRMRSLINTPPRRMLGVLKVRAEWAGVVAGTEFVLWEKRDHATRAVGRIRGRRGGSRVEAHIGVTRRTWVLMVVFFAMFALASFGLLTRIEGLGITPSGISVVALGALVMLTYFWTASLRQRAALKAVLNEVCRAAEPA